VYLTCLEDVRSRELRFRRSSLKEGLEKWQALLGETVTLSIL
jgi:hypothetical protein